MRISSSIADDVWHHDRTAGAYEWWYFDAVSDDGRDALVVIFLSGFLFSPAYNRAVARALKRPDEDPPHAANFPAIAICHYRDGRPRLRSVTEYEPHEFEAYANRPFARVGNNFFRYDAENLSGPSYELNLNQNLRRGRSLEARLVWQIADGDLLPPRDEFSDSVHDWNLVAPRCAVSGEFAVRDANGRQIERLDFRGSGYHDHNRDRRWIPRTVDQWQWGRAHFASATAVYYRFRERGADEATARLFVVPRGGELSAHQASFGEGRRTRHVFGLSYPRRMEFAADGGALTLRVEQRRVIDGSFFYLRFLSEATIRYGDGREERAPAAVSEHLAPRPLAWRSLWWLINMRIGRGDRASFLP